MALCTLGSSDISQKHEDILPDDGMPQAQNSLVTPVEEVNHVEYKAECVIYNVSRLNSDGSQSKESMNDTTEWCTLCTTNCCAGTLVMETGPVDNVPTDCSEVELAHNTDENCTKVTLCCINWTLSSQNKINSEEETGVNTTKSFIHTLQKQFVTLRRNDVSIDEEPMFRDVRAFVGDHDGTFCNELNFGSNRKNFVYSDSFTPGNLELAGSKDDIANLHPVCRNAPAVDDHKNETTSQIVTGYINPVYPVLVKNSIKVYSTNLFASLPQHDKFLVKQKLCT